MNIFQDKWSVAVFYAAVFINVDNDPKTSQAKNGCFNLKIHYQMFGCGQELLIFVKT